MLSQELSLLREAVFPYLLCSAAREGNIETLERLRQAVSCSLHGFIFATRCCAEHGIATASRPSVCL